MSVPSIASNRINPSFNALDELQNEVTDLSAYVYSLPGGIETLQQTLSAGNNAGGLNILNLGNLAIGKATATLPLDISGREIISVPGAPAGNVRDDIALTLSKSATTSTTNKAIIRLLTRGGGGGLVYGHIGHRLLSTSFGLYFNTVEDPDVINMSINGTGQVGIGLTTASFQLQLSTDSAGKPATNTWTVVSDKRIKDEIIDADLTRCYDIVKSLPLRRYTWKEDFYTTEQVNDRSKLGWIADEVEVVFPKAVGVIPEWTYKQETETEEAKKIENLKSLNADQIYAVMYGAIQKLIQEVETLKHEVETLKSTSS